MPKPKKLKKTKEVVRHAERETISRDAEAAPEEAPEVKKPVSKDLPTCGPNQRLFESPDGRVYVGARDASSIPDPLNPDAEINPRR